MYIYYKRKKKLLKKKKSDKMGILSVDPNNINLDDAIFYEDDPKTIIHVMPDLA